MSESDIQEYYDFILPLVLDAGKIILQAKDIKGELKNGLDCDFVTIFDTKIENILNKQIADKYPNHKFIGEEESSGKEYTLTDDPTWIIDPIDGTENFMRQMRLSCISVAMTINKEQVFGIAYNPNMDELFTAIKGKGAYLNRERIYTTNQKDYTKSLFNYELSIGRMSTYFYNLYMFRLKHLLPKVMGVRCFGCAVLGLCYVACGRFDAYQCDGLFPWDAAAGTLIVREAGGFVIDSSGKDFDLMNPNFLATSSKELAEQYLQIEREADEEMKKTLERKSNFVP
ncbi:inositol monophosphatase 1-like [Rhynchophorus ferrugineus]|uniref:inositol monophosphatase 1-like n=1 Tax=Rhynchophorus ferrugineus TaxID=354439 RepID=UPI003FCC2850